MKHILYFTKQIHSFAGKILYFNLIAMIFISLFESIGIFMLVPLISLTGIIEVKSLQLPLFNWSPELFGGLPDTISLVIILGLYIVLVSVQGIFQRSQTILNTKIQQGFTRHLREETYKHILQANWGFFLRKRKSDITNAMINEIARVSGGTSLFLQFFASFIFTFVQIGVAFWLSAKMTLSILFFGALLLLCSKKFITRSKELGDNTVQLSKTFLGGITDHFNGIKDIKSNSVEKSHISWFHSLNIKMENNMVELVKVKTSSQVLYKMVSTVLMALFVFFSINMFKNQPAQIILITVIFSRIWPRLAGIQSSLEQLGTIVPSFKALIELQQECLDSKEVDETLYETIEPLKIKNGIEVQNVNFSYEKSLYALKNINVSIPCNQMTAVVGRSGAGKSTLVDILMGLNQPEDGYVLLDGKMLKQDNLLAWRKSISYVSQDPFLFNASVRENLLLIDPKATDEQMWQALEFAAATEFVEKLPDGLDTLIGDRGIKLSGGERQRLVLARAILRKPSILVLDEATSALDSENEAKIQGALDRLKGEMTIIIIAHRLSTIKNADQVIVLEQGKIIQSGGYLQLANDKRGVFSHLLQKQVDAIS
ncbi:ABC transporter ATP-binding protein [Mesobacillus foraminis]|uniref:ABC transporter ATP-binding protein n=1 Tax=Mesobacillus foraminis TaxID=279826 RepID=UPI000EF4E1EC|nr:ABC transporter ATP-binding protein [Mesobacillus foraminis]